LFNGGQRANASILSFEESEMAAQQPLKSFRARTSSGRIEVAVWKNENDGNTNYSVTLRKTYKDGDDYKESKSLLENDLLIVARTVGHAWDFIQRDRNDC